MTSGGTAEAAHSLDNQADRERTVKGKIQEDHIYGGEGLTRDTTWQIKLK